MDLLLAEASDWLLSAIVSELDQPSSEKLSLLHIAAANKLYPLVRLCSRSASFTLSEAKLGLCPAVISKYVVREWSVPLARQAMLTGRPVTVDELNSIGVVTVACSHASELENATDSVLGSLRFLSPSGSRMSKELVALGWKYGGRSEQHQRVSELFDEMLRPGSEGAYGAAEFQASRKVDWDAYRADKQKTVKPKL